MPFVDCFEVLWDMKPLQLMMMTNDHVVVCLLYSMTARLMSVAGRLMSVAGRLSRWREEFIWRVIKKFRRESTELLGGKGVKLGGKGFANRRTRAS